MAITATQEGRNLHLTVEGIDAPIIVRPLPGHAGVQITDTYLRGAISQAPADEITAALIMALDGATKDPDTGLWSPVDPALRGNSDLIGNSLSLGEMEDVSMAAFFWQTVLSDTGVNIYLAGGGGVGGHTKAMEALLARMGLSPLRISPSSALDDLMSMASTPSTSTPQGGAKPGKKPRDRQPKKANARKA